MRPTASFMCRQKESPQFLDSPARLVLCGPGFVEGILVGILILADLGHQMSTKRPRA